MNQNDHNDADDDDNESMLIEKEEKEDLRLQVELVQTLIRGLESRLIRRGVELSDMELKAKEEAETSHLDCENLRTLIKDQPIVV